jgi:hypothetical protein
MITIRAWRSAKWPGASFQPSVGITSGPPMSSASASAQSPAWSWLSANEAAASSPTPTAVLANRPSTERLSSGSSRLATMNRAICPSRTTA